MSKRKRKGGSPRPPIEISVDPGVDGIRIEVGDKTIEYQDSVGMTCPECGSEKNRLVGIDKGVERWRCENGHEVARISMGNPVTSFTRRPLPPAERLRDIPSVEEADAKGCKVAYLRFYEEGGRGEWFVLGLNGYRAFAWVASPWGEGPRGASDLDELGMVDLTAMDYYQQFFDCGEIRWDQNFLPQPFEPMAAFDGKDPLG